MTVQTNIGAVPTLSGHDLTSAIRLRDRLRVIEIDRSAGPSVSQNDLELLRHHIMRLDKDTVDGIIITHGTDTVEETAFFLALTTEPSVPVLLTGASLPSDHSDGDGLRNIEYAISHIDHRASPAIYVAFGGRLYNPFTVSKEHSTSRTPFSDTDGTMDFPLIDYNGFALPVWIAKPGLLDRLEWLEYVSTEQVRAIVVEGTGVGNVPEQVEQRLIHLARSIPVLLTTRCRHGGVRSL